eukprot:CAMPEP_0174818632 /NCGR_PEP_ID=MMETSP1107-20130205/1432_1 /TAXON_ID=36770 /ORGANISM="Paraphysomonas vestita, Strain GFlagA" /LENGTH=332 /DNA_ID=CAMNT_0016030787 /DNA_START=499 /DNA_END=1497 /DNA_ORIENTATION=+
MPTLQTLDIQHNRINDIGIVDIVAQMPDLRVLYLQGNPVVKEIRHYRKVIIGRCKELRYLDDRPVFDDERRRVKAWYEAYLASDGNVDVATEAERNELALLRKEREEADERNRQAFEELIRQGEQVKKQRALEAERTGQVSIYGATGINGEFNPYSMESIIPVPENPELKELREQRLQDILSKGSDNNNNNNNTISENIENNIPNSNNSNNSNVTSSEQIIISQNEETITQSNTSNQVKDEEKDIKWTKFKIMEADDDDDDDNHNDANENDDKEENHDHENPNNQEHQLETEKGIELSELQVDDIDFTLTIQDNEDVNDGEEGTSTDLYELD